MAQVLKFDSARHMKNFAHGNETKSEKIRREKTKSAAKFVGVKTVKVVLTLLLACIFFPLVLFGLIL
jgi:hypothetical protein